MQPAEFLDTSAFLWDRGAIEKLSFEEPKLLHYSSEIAGGFQPTKVAFSSMKSGARNLVVCGMGCRAFHEYWHTREETGEGPVLNYRSALLLEQQSTISLAATIEVLVGNLLAEKGAKGTPNYTFGSVVQHLHGVGIRPEAFGFLSDPAVWSKVRDSFDLLFNLRNLVVHNGGIVDREFQKRYKKRAPTELTLGKLVRIPRPEQLAIREFTGVFVQELCRNVEGYKAVWNDFVQAVGIYIVDPFVKPEFSDGTIGPETSLREGD